MSEGTHGEHGRGDGQWEIHGKRVRRFEDFERERAEVSAGGRVALAEAERAFAEAAAKYSQTLHAVRESSGEAFKASGPIAAPAAKAAELMEGEPGYALTDHNYDGIQEYDNPTPGWWWLVFGGSIAFAVLYVMVYHFSPFVPSILDQYASAEQRALQVQFAELNDVPMGEAKILTIMSEESWLEQGRAVYLSAACATCHGEDGQGLVGPNLTDGHYKNLTSLMGFVEVIRDGAANGAMPAQRNLLNENEIAVVSAYVASLRGQNLDGPRGEEGEPIAPWPELTEDGEVIGSTPAIDGETAIASGS
ncbi:MAG: cbb3-type cytochrome c oxidase N-terminal domain-containing protein [Planctomycetota bacterium]